MMATLPGIDDSQLQAIAQAAKLDCLLSKAPASVPEISLHATLLASRLPAARMSQADIARTLVAALTTVDHMLGDPRRQLTLLDYSHCECPFCARAEPLIVERVGAAHPVGAWPMSLQRSGSTFSPRG